jgi:putative membrane protein
MKITREIPPAAASALATAAVYGILGTALSRRPPELLPSFLPPLLAALPLIIAVINAAALFCLLAGWRAIRRRRVQPHRAFMLTAAGLISLFLVLYVSRVSLGGVKAFPGPPTIRAYVYLPILAVHVMLSIVSVPVVIYNIFTGITRGPAGVPDTNHARVGRTAVLLWSVSLALGIAVYVLLNVLY